MRVQDFMIGDYVCNQNNVPIKISEAMFIRYMHDEGSFVLMFKPVELTDNIIHNNFSTDSNKAFIKNNSIEFKYYFDLKTYVVNYEDKRFIGNIKYVHQLQQLFRIFCIDKELTL